MTNSFSLIVLLLFSLTSHASDLLVPHASVNDFAAPVINNRSSVVAPQAGTIILDSSNGAFYGYHYADGWVSLSAASTADHVESKSSGFTNYTSINVTGLCAADAWCDVATLSLPQGEWDIAAQAMYYSTSATTSTDQLFIAVSNTSGNTGSGTAYGDNKVGKMRTTDAEAYDTISFAAYKVVPGSTTTYYLKSWIGGSIANMQIAYRVSARKIR